MLPDPTKMCLSVVPNRFGPKFKLHTSISHAKNAIAVKRNFRVVKDGNANWENRPGGGQIYQLVDMEWQLVYDVPVGGPLPWA